MFMKRFPFLIGYNKYGSIVPNTRRKDGYISKVVFNRYQRFWSNEDEINWKSRRGGDSTIVGWDHWLNFLFIARSTC